MKKYSLLAALILVAISSGTSVQPSEASEPNKTPAVIDTGDNKSDKAIDKDLCIELLWEIVEIQNFRRAYQLGYDEMVHRHRAGQITDEKMASYTAAWELAQKSLKTQLDEATLRADAAGCFKKEE